MPKISIFSMSLEDPILQRNNCKDRLTWLTATFYTQLILRQICNMHRYRIKPNKCVILISVSRITSDREISDKMLRLQHFSPKMNVDNEGKLKKSKLFGFTRSRSLNHALPPQGSSQRRFTTSGNTANTNMFVRQ